MEMTRDVKFENYRQNRIHPQKFGLWISFASIMMLFAALTSAYIVRRAAGNWLEFELPSIFYTSTIILLLSSVFLHFSYQGFKKMKSIQHRMMLVLAFLFGVGFVILQYQGWMTLFDMGIELNGNPSGSFLYIISGVHVVHILGGLATLIVAMIHAFSLPCVPSQRRLLRFDLVRQYWHFVDVLWIYLLIFLLIQ